MSNDELRKLAEAATSGPWAWEMHGDTMEGGVGVVIDANDNQLSGHVNGDLDVWEAVAPEVNGAANCAYIAAANPAAILALLAENERLRHGMKGDYDLDAWLGWAEEAERLRSLLADAEARVAGMAPIADCPNCPNQGWYIRSINGEPEHEQCQFCYMAPNSRFNLKSVIPSAPSKEQNDAS